MSDEFDYVLFPRAVWEESFAGQFRLSPSRLWRTSSLFLLFYSRRTVSESGMDVTKKRQQIEMKIQKGESNKREIKLIYFVCDVRRALQLAGE